MTCTYCQEPSEYVLHMKLCRVPEEGEDENVVDVEADVCLACGDTIIKNEMKRAEWHDNKL
jgi:hypothetical protein